MSIVINRDTLQIRLSADPAEHDSSGWLINPNRELTQQVLSGEVPKRHTKIEGDEYVLRSAEEISEADAEYLAELKLQKIADIRQQFNEAFNNRYTPLAQLAATNLRTNAMASMNDEQLDYLDQLLTWGLQGDDLVESAEGQVYESTTEEELNAVTLDLSGWLENDPKVSTRLARRM